MLSYDDVRQRPEQFLACTGLTVDAFDILLDSFSRAWDEYRKKNDVNSGGGKPKLSRVVDTLFFYPFLLQSLPDSIGDGGYLRYESVEGLHMDSCVDSRS